MTNRILNVSDAAFSANNPGELDYLRPNSFKFMVHNIPNVSYFCQAANIPEINIPAAEQPTPLVDIPYPGDKLQFGPLMIRFLVQEDMMNYKELYDWLIGLGFPEDHNKHQSINRDNNTDFQMLIEKNYKVLHYIQTLAYSC